MILEKIVFCPFGPPEPQKNTIFNKNTHKWPPEQFTGYGGLKSFAHRGTKVTQVRGGQCQPIGGLGAPLILSQSHPKLHFI